MTRVSAATRAALGLAVVVCVLGCLAPIATASPCVGDEDCATYEVCSNSTCVTDCAAANSCGACLSRPGCTFCENAGVWQGCVANAEAAICTTNSAIEYTDTGACPAYTPTCNQLPGTCESCLDNAYNLTCALCKATDDGFPAGLSPVVSSTCISDPGAADSFECPGWMSDDYLTVTTEACETECETDEDCWFTGAAMDAHGTCTGGRCSCPGNFGRDTDDRCQFHGSCCQSTLDCSVTGCPSGQYCNYNMTRECEDGCNSDSDCGDGYRCDDNTCMFDCQQHTTCGECNTEVIANCSWCELSSKEVAICLNEAEASQCTGLGGTAYEDEPSCPAGDVDACNFIEPTTCQDCLDNDIGLSCGACVRYNPDGFIEDISCATALDNSFVNMTFCESYSIDPERDFWTGTCPLPVECEKTLDCGPNSFCAGGLCECAPGFSPLLHGHGCDNVGPACRYNDTCGAGEYCDYGDGCVVNCTESYQCDEGYYCNGDSGACEINCANFTTCADCFGAPSGSECSWCELDGIGGYCSTGSECVDLSGEAPATVGDCPAPVSRCFFDNNWGSLLNQDYESDCDTCFSGAATGCALCVGDPDDDEARSFCIDNTPESIALICESSVAIVEEGDPCATCETNVDCLGDASGALDVCGPSGVCFSTAVVLCDDVPAVPFATAASVALCAGYAAGDHCAFECESGYDDFGEAFCTSDGTWTFVGCLPEPCESSELSAIDFANTSSVEACGDVVASGSECAFACDGGKFASGPAMCAFGNWSMVTCEDEPPTTPVPTTPIPTTSAPTTTEAPSETCADIDICDDCAAAAGCVWCQTSEEDESLAFECKASAACTADNSLTCEAASSLLEDEAASDGGNAWVAPVAISGGVVVAALVGLLVFLFACGGAAKLCGKKEGGQSAVANVKPSETNLSSIKSSSSSSSSPSSGNGTSTTSSAA